MKCLNCDERIRKWMESDLEIDRLKQIIKNKDDVLEECLEFLKEFQSGNIYKDLIKNCKSALEKK